MSIPNVPKKEVIKDIIKKLSDKQKIFLYTDIRITLGNPEDVKKILEEYHDAPTGGHQGISRTLKRIKKHFNWDTMTKDVTNYIQKCTSCQINKSKNIPLIPMKITTTSSKPFERIALDVVGPLPVSHSGNRYILTFQDDLTKFSEAFPIENMEASTVARVFVEKIICRHGIPSSLLTDQGTNFLSTTFKEMSKLLKIRKINTTPYHPQTNGALERSHRTLSEYLRHYTNQDPLTWDTWIPYAMFVYNTTPHSSTNYMPYELLYGYPASIPNSLDKKPEISYNYDNYVNELRSRLQHGYQVAKEILITKKQNSKSYYDKGTRIKQINVGDKVLLRKHARKNKLDTLWEGPYTVLKLISDQNTLIQIGKKTKNAHNNDLKVFIE